LGKSLGLAYRKNRLTAQSRTLSLPAALVAANLGAFFLSAQTILSGTIGISHHWLFPFHEALLLVQAAVFRRAWAVKPLAGLSWLIMLLTVARLETIYISHHAIHSALTYAIGAALHVMLGSVRDAPWRGFNRRFAAACAIGALGTAYAAWKQGIWWGLEG